jgi:hypothetical protein
MTRPYIALIVVCPLLTGCIFFESAADRQMEKSANYKQGYSDGCATVSSKSANFREQNDYRDRALFRTDKAYRAGWSAGYTACRPALGYQEPQKGPIPDPYPPR